MTDHRTPTRPPASPRRSPPKPLFDEAIVRAAFPLFVPAGGVAEVRALEATHATDRYPGTWFGYFTDPDALVAELASLRAAEGVYVTLNPVTPALLARSSNRLRKAGKKGVSVSDADVVGRRWVLVDCDPKRPTGISSDDREHGLALMRAQIIRDELGADGWPEPVLADSANGAHLLYAVDLPPEDDNLVARCLAALQARFGDDPKKPKEATGGVAVVVDVTTANAARITKLYGTRGCKGDDTPERPHRVSRLLDVPAEFVPVPRDLLESLVATKASEAAREPAAGDAPRRAASPRGPGGFEVSEWLCRHRIAVTGPEDWAGRGGSGRRWVFATCPWNADHSDGSAYVLQFDGGGVAAGCHHNGCAGKGWHELRDVVEPGWRTSAAGAKAGRAVDKTLAGDAGTGFRQLSTLGPTEKRGHLGEAPARNLYLEDDDDDDDQFIRDPVIPQYVPFPAEELPQVVGRYVVEAAGSLDCDAGYVAVPLLAALASAVGNTRRVRLKREWTEPAVVWSAVVGESGTVKSPALELATRAVWRRQSGILQDHARERAAYDAEHKAWKATPKNQRGEEPERPGACEHPVVSDITIEALADRLLATPRGTLVAIDELGAWFGSFNAYKARGGDVSHWLALHGARALKVDRKTGDRTTTYVPHAAVCVTGTIQPATLRRLLVPEFFDNGLAARILLAMPPTRVKRWTDAEISPTTVGAVEDLFDALYALRAAPGVGGEDEPVAVDLTPEALGLWVGFVNAHNESMGSVRGPERAAYAKLEGYAARFALLVHVARQATAEKVSDYVEADDVRAGVRLAGWFGAETRRVYARLREVEAAGRHRDVAELVAARGGSATARELSRSSRMFKTADDWNAVLEEMVTKGLGRWQYPEVGPDGGRPSRVFHLLRPVDS